MSQPLRPAGIPPLLTPLKLREQGRTLQAVCQTSSNDRFRGKQSLTYALVFSGSNDKKKGLQTIAASLFNIKEGSGLPYYHFHAIDNV